MKETDSKLGNWMKEPRDESKREGEVFETPEQKRIADKYRGGKDQGGASESTRTDFETEKTQGS